MRPYQTDVDWRRTTNYAAATGDDNRLYFDDRRPEGLFAPSMLAVALTWPLSSNIGDYLELKDFPRGILLTQVHYTERLDFHRLVRPGTTISLELKSRNKEDLFFEVMNQEGEKAVSKGYARIID